MGVGDDKVMLNIEKYGNTTNGTIPLYVGMGNQLNKGDNIILAFGGGPHGDPYILNGLMIQINIVYFCIKNIKSFTIKNNTDKNE